MDVFRPIWKDLVRRLFEEEVLSRLMHKVHCIFADSQERPTKVDNLSHITANILKLLDEFD
jgi:hypothetical protein